MPDQIENQKIKVIIADDHPMFRSGMESALKGMKCIEKTMQAENGGVVIGILEKDFYDIVLMDIRMPQMDGLEATRIIQSRFPKTKVIAVSMDDDEEKIITMLRSGASGYLLKNASSEEISLAILNVMAGKKYFSGEVADTIARSLLNNLDTGSKEETENPQEISEERTREIIFLICHELTQNEIADLIFVTSRAIQYHVRKVYSMTGIKNQIGIVKYAQKTGILDDPALNKKWKPVIEKRRRNQ